MSSPLAALTSLVLAVDVRCRAELEVQRAQRRFGKAVASNRKVSPAAFARKLGIGVRELRMLEAGEKPWGLSGAELAVKLLTRREDWPD